MNNENKSVKSGVITSKNTSINTTRLPAVYNKIDWKKLRNFYLAMYNYEEDKLPFVLDYGCGRKTDHIQKYVEFFGFKYIGYDPYWAPNAILPLVSKNIGIVICSNVLNVIASDSQMKTIHSICASISPENFYFITVYEGDRSGKGKISKKDCWQRNQPTEFYINKCLHEEIKNKVITSAPGTIYIKTKFKGGDN